MYGRRGIFIPCARVRLTFPHGFPKLKKHRENKIMTLHHHNQNDEELLSAMPAEDDFGKASDVFQQLCDPTRLRILWILAHSEQCVNNIALLVGMSTSAVSHHLRTLRQTGLITNRREGKEMYYKLASDETAVLVHSMIDDIFETDCLK